MKEECLICQAPLEYLGTETLMECALCHRQEMSQTRCINGHYVCNECHTKGMDAVIEGLPLVAHNSPFDESCLKAVFRVYQMDYPDYPFYDTLSVSRQTLPELENHQLYTVAAACGYQLDHHHHALADAEACAWIAREIL